MSIDYLEYIDFVSFDSLLEKFNKITGFVTAILDLEGNIISQSGWRNICVNFHRVHPESSKGCLYSDTVLANRIQEHESFSLYKCQNGLVDVAVPLIIKKQHIANIFSGQFFLEEPDIGFFKKQATLYGFDEQAYISALKEVPIVSQEQVKNVMNYLQEMTQIISETTIQKAEQKILAQSLVRKNDSIRVSEEKYRVLFNTFHLGIAITDPDGNILENNDRAIEIFNLTKEEFKARRIDDKTWKFVHLDGTPLSPEEFPSTKALHENRLIENVETGIVNADSSITWVTITAAPLALENYGVVITVDDITLRRKAEKEYQSLFSEMLDGFALHEIIVNEFGEPIDYRFLAINPSFERMTGLCAEQIIGKTALEVLPGTERYWIETYGKVALTGEPIVFENYAIEMGKYFQVVSFRPALNQFSTIFIDITQRKMAEKELHVRLEYEQLLSKISTDAASTDNLDLFAQDCLAAIGEAFTVSRVFIFEYEKEYATYEWNCYGSKGYLAQPQSAFSKDSLSWFITIMRRKKASVFSDIEDVPDKTTREMLKDQDVKSLLVIPLFIQETSFGFIGLVDCVSSREWPEIDVTILLSISQIFSTVTERIQMKERLLYQHSHDFLTGIYNRGFLEKELLRLEDEQYLPVSFIIADTNGLKLINDSFGHSIGDEMLKRTAEILEGTSKPGDIIARYGGDEFVMLLPNSDYLVAEERIKIIEDMTKHVDIHDLQLSLAFGYQIRKSVYDDFPSVFKSAEDMMYRNKLYESSSNKYKTIELVMNSLFAKSPRESQHSKRVSKICECIATKMNLSARDVNRMRIAGLMHDIGKIGVRETILNKPGRLSLEEWGEMKRHPETGYKILSASSDFIDISPAVLEHHERWDGKGYPRGISGENISLQARIINVADSYDAMTSKRSYQHTMAKSDAFEEIKNCSGTQFDPQVISIFMENMQEILEIR